MATIDEDFRDLLEVPRVGEPAADQLRHAAAALSAMPAEMATAISCTRRVPKDQRAEFAALAARRDVRARGAYRAGRPGMRSLHQARVRMMSRYSRVLIVEDDESLCRVLKRNLAA